MLPEPIITTHNGIYVLRDDLLPGGTKRRAIYALFDGGREYVYASPVYGYAQLALAYAAQDYGKQATVFCAKRKARHYLTVEAEAAGANIIEVPNGYLTVVTARAREYCYAKGAKLLPFGLDCETFINALADVARRLPGYPDEVWTVGGSGTLTRALQLAWPTSAFFCVQVGADGDFGRATVFKAPMRYEKPAQFLPPFASCLNYDAKAWEFVSNRATPGAFFWNVGK